MHGGIHRRDSLSSGGGATARGLPASEGEQRNIHHPQEPLCYQQHKDSHTCSPVIPTCISNDFQKKEWKGVNNCTLFPLEAEKAFLWKSVAWFTFFSSPFLSMCFPSHCFMFPAFCFSDLSLAPFSSHPLIQYEVWNLQQLFPSEKACGLHFGMSLELCEQICWRVDGSRVILTDRTAIQFWIFSQTIYRDKHQKQIRIYGGNCPLPSTQHWIWKFSKLYYTWNWFLMLSGVRRWD